jgi:para-nitrobenzyl esterase
MKSRRGGGGGGTGFSGGGGEDDTLPVEESTEGRRISEAMLDYWAAFMRTGKPEAQNRPAWPAFSPASPKAMVFGNKGIDSKSFAAR